ncbi:MAG TPA: serine/threonine protein phosphatase [Cytophagales bacterium]|nr:serine/threonine protein phosphatase [Cytophagales bacterium]HAA20021.1 serine/threonine protein phosphatase [Cytophagales bacterium]HAP64654.1 serine/threonine protein phosphatase [Cytophagales bacterium]
MPKRVAISDIHGCQRSFQRLIDRLNLQEGDHLYLLGDYIDRGPHVKEVMDYLFQLQKAKFEVTMLRGNHEQLLLDSIKDAQTHALWVKVGGYATLSSFGVSKAEDIPSEYLEFFDSLSYYVDLPDYYLVHGGFNLTLEDPFDDPWSMMNLRDFYVDDTFLQGRQIVRGHVPTMLSKIQEDLKKEDAPIITIDNGCVYSEVWGLGNLLAYDMDKKSLIMQPYIDGDTL